MSKYKLLNFIIDDLECYQCRDEVQRILLLKGETDFKFDFETKILEITTAETPERITEIIGTTGFVAEFKK